MSKYIKVYTVRAVNTAGNRLTVPVFYRSRKDAEDCIPYCVWHTLYNTKIYAYVHPAWMRAEDLRAAGCAYMYK